MTVFLCQETICKPGFCKKFCRCPGDVKAMRRQRDAELEFKKDATGYACIVCHQGCFQMPGSVCASCQAVYNTQRDLF